MTDGLDYWKDCPKCGGLGLITVIEDDEGNWDQWDCDVCEGKGKIEALQKPT